MEASTSANNLRKIIEKAIEDHELSQAEYDLIISEASKDNIIDSQEQALLSQLRDLIENKTIKLVP